MTPSAHRAEHARLIALMPRRPEDYEPWGDVERYADPDLGYPDCSGGCKWASWLENELGGDWCVCTNPKSHRVGLLTYEHQSGFGCFEQEESDDD